MWALGTRGWGEGGGIVSNPKGGDSNKPCLEDCVRDPFLIRPSVVRNIP